MYKAKMRCVALLIIMLSMVSCGQNRPEQNDTEQNTSEVTEEMTPNTITTTAVSNEETEPVDSLMSARKIRPAILLRCIPLTANPRHTPDNL